MNTHVRIPCPHCAESLKVRVAYAGQQVDCKKCNRSFVVPKDVAEVGATQEAASAPGAARRPARPPSDEYTAYDRHAPEQVAADSTAGALDAERLRSDDLQQELVAAQEELRTLRNQIVALQSANAWADQLEENWKAAQAEVERLRSERQQAESRLLSDQADNSAHLARELEAARTEGESLRASLAELKPIRAERDRLAAEVDRLRAEIEADRAAAHQGEQSLASRIEELERSLGEATAGHESERAEWESALSVERGRAGEHEQAAAERTRQLEQERAESRARADALIGERDTHAARVDELSVAAREADERHRADLSRLERAVDEAERRAAEAEARAASLASERDEAVRLHDEALAGNREQGERLAAELERRRLERDQLAEDLDRTRREADEHASQLAMLREERDRANSAYELRVRELEEQIAAREREQVRMEEERSHREAERERQLEEALGQVGQLEATLSVTIAARNTAEVSLRDASLEIESLKSELRETDDSRKRLHNWLGGAGIHIDQYE